MASERRGEEQADLSDSGDGDGLESVSPWTLFRLVRPPPTGQWVNRSEALVHGHRS